MYEADELTSLSNLAEGAAIELFDFALQDAVANIEDPNRDPLAERKITMTVILKPSKTRQGMIDVEIKVEPKLQARKVINTILNFGRVNGKLETREIHLQMPLPFDNNGNRVIKMPNTEED